jgi:Undecaprenyl-phosphate glucose phosphotransferase
MLIGDLLFVSAAWWIAYWIRFHSGLVPTTETFDFQHYLAGGLLIPCVWTIVFRQMDFYRPRRISTHGREFVDLVKASVLALLTFLGIVFVIRDLVLSRIVVLLFWCTSIFLLNVSHLVFREGLRFLRRRGYNLRQAVVIGTAPELKQLVAKLQWYRHLGLQIAAAHLIGTEKTEVLPGVPNILSNEAELIKFVVEREIDQVFVTLPLQQAGRLPEIQSWLGDEPVTVHFVPDLGALAKLRGSVEEFDGLSIMTLQSSPLYGWNSVIKRSMDVVLGALALGLFSPLMLLIAAAIKFTSPGPVLYRQERMGLDGQRFEMLKFRTMIHDAEQVTGPVWAQNNDPRVTRLGYWLRQMSLDELPQLFNVIKGEMSLVGPRPERPPLIEEFRKEIPGYMLRHKVKAGMTGWAQINGWRGNTSLPARIAHDIDYIERWSVWRDVKILTATLLGGFRNY